MKVVAPCFYNGIRSFSAKYFSKIENLDKAIEDFEKTTKAAGGSIQPIEYMDYLIDKGYAKIAKDPEDILRLIQGADFKELDKEYFFKTPTKEHNYDE